MSVLTQLARTTTPCNNSPLQRITALTVFLDALNHARHVCQLDTVAPELTTAQRIEATCGWVYIDTALIAITSHIV
jgi:hypothetical protein